jgi:hypothetical protein
MRAANQRTEIAKSLGGALDTMSVFARVAKRPDQQKEMESD